MASAFARGPGLLRASSAQLPNQQYKDLLRQNTDELIARGGYGSPTLFIDGDDMYFGNDRLELVRISPAAAEWPLQ